jgi:hypothetical protein
MQRAESRFRLGAILAAALISNHVSARPRSIRYPGRRRSRSIEKKLHGSGSIHARITWTPCSRRQGPHCFPTDWADELSLAYMLHRESCASKRLALMRRRGPPSAKEPGRCQASCYGTKVRTGYGPPRVPLLQVYKPHIIKIIFEMEPLVFAPRMIAPRR